MKNMSRIQRQSGAVSLFMVVFAMLLMSVVTISFLRIMTADQNQASGNDLAQSAYDSAGAGVEDAKRALIWYIGQCKSGSATACATAKSTISSTECNVAVRMANGWGAEDGEIKVQQSSQVDVGSGQSIDQALDQAYTCATIQLDTDDFLASVSADQSVLVPLAGKSAFSTVDIEWFSEDDLSSAGAEAAPDTSSTNPKYLLTRATWPTNRPSVLRTQFMQVGANFKLTDFDATTTDSKSNANTVFLYPSTSGVSSADLTARDTRANPAGESTPAGSNSAPLPTRCVAVIPSGGYSCKVTLQLPTPVGAADRTNATAFLRLTSFYVGSHVRVTLGGTKFDGVQPVVDSTGRANNVFRRVQSRVDLYDTTTFPYPDAAVDVNGSLCKDFGITDTKYLPGSCTP